MGNVRGSFTCNKTEKVPVQAVRVSEAARVKLSYKLEDNRRGGEVDNGDTAGVLRSHSELGQCA